MTIKDYILGKFQEFGLTDAQLVELGTTLPLDEEYSSANATLVGKSMCDLVAEMVFKPRQKSINEKGFSVSWDYANLGRYYLWLCKRYGVKPDDSVTDMLGISIIKDRTSMW